MIAANVRIAYDRRILAAIHMSPARTDRWRCEDLRRAGNVCYGTGSRAVEEGELCCEGEAAEGAVFGQAKPVGVIGDSFASEPGVVDDIQRADCGVHIYDGDIWRFGEGRYEGTVVESWPP